ncbi:type III secretion system export apparatus subunit SctT [Pandoraea sputorum]|uniref:type III secretion system export apparatus subunit SctT n=1 Tax=Pandoraea sputorum TaxID=93222 RepID=UPI002AF6C303|nr:type III secretion system export apparatus subunit SctT [Pandoraea sputorum]
MHELAQTVHLTKDFALAWIMAWPRAIALFTMLPFFRNDTLPGLLRFCMVGVLCLPLAPVLQPQLTASELSGPTFFLLLAKEALIGFVMGLPIALLFWAAESMGAMIDNQSGASVASVLNPASGNDVATLAALLNQIFMVSFLLLGGMSWLIDTLYQSYLSWPPTLWWPSFNATGMDWWLGRLDDSLRTAVVLAGPIALGLFMVELGFGLIGRFAPRMQVFVLAMPIKNVLSVLLLGAYLGTLLPHFGDLAQTLKEVVRSALEVTR